jgi:MoaA/NifB/PqqE/SkfB family radical SAM enzyme
MGVNDGNGLRSFRILARSVRRFLPIVAGNVREQSFAEIYRNSPLFRELAIRRS